MKIFVSNSEPVQVSVERRFTIKINHTKADEVNVNNILAKTKAIAVSVEFDK